MMNDTYVEVMVKCKPSILMRVLQILCIVLAAGSFLFLLGLPGILLAVAFGVAAYFAGLQTNVEFEYLYVDRELTVDKIMARSKRKKVDKVDLGKMEILAPMNSWHLDEYKNRQFKKVADYSSKEKEQKPERRYVLIYEGEKKLIFEPTKEMVKAIQTTAPRKVFLD